ncbi:hypothetical protein V6N12_072994 [Hibiscus sabdariffa]|uniref:Uncharacterized protein n=1 Tax=Hibiscus sabdariffa TaxID=183260 RepID=A0ABR1ZG08_9ROSI
MASLFVVMSEEFVCNTGEDEMLECRGLRTFNNFCYRFSLPRDLLTDVLMCKEAWPFSGEGVVVHSSQVVGNDLNNLFVISDIPISVSLDDQTHLRNLAGATPSVVVGGGEVNLRHLVTLTSTIVSPTVEVPVGIFAVENALPSAPTDVIEASRESTANRIKFYSSRKHALNRGDKTQGETSIIVTGITEKSLACSLEVAVVAPTAIIVAGIVICPGGTIISSKLLLPAIVTAGGCGPSAPCDVFFPWRGNHPETVEWLHPNLPR